MSNELNASLTTYTFLQTQTTIRTVTIEGVLWFIASDVCKALTLAQHPSGGYQHHLRHINEDEKRVETPTTLRIWGCYGLNSRTTILTESGLYKLAMRCDKPIAKPFQNWVTQVVLPAIRKDGAYIVGEEKVATGELDEDAFVLKAIGILQAKVERLKAEKEAAEAKALVLVLEAKTEELVEENETISAVSGVPDSWLQKTR